MCSNNCTERIEKVFKECLQSMIDSVFQKLSTQLSYRTLPLNTSLQLPRNQETSANEIAISSNIDPSLASLFGSVLVSSVHSQGRRKKRRRRRNNNNHRDAPGYGELEVHIIVSIVLLNLLFLFPDTRTLTQWPR